MTGCTCSDCLAHREPQEYGERAKLIALVTQLREALECLHAVVEDQSCVVSDIDDDGQRYSLVELPPGVERVVREALAAARKTVPT